MPVSPTYPGVYIEEIPSGVRTITGVATSIAAFIGRAKRGPVNIAKTINSFADYERIFGGLDLNSTMSFAVKDFYLNGGSQAVIVRLYHPESESVRQAAESVADATTGATATEAATNARTKADEFTDKPEKSAANKVATAAEIASAKENVNVKTVFAAAKAEVPGRPKSQFKVGSLPLEAAYDGSWGANLRAEITINEDAPPEVAENLGLTEGDLFNLTVRDLNIGGSAESFQNLSLKDSFRRIDKVLKEESKLVRWKGDYPSTDLGTLGEAKDKVTEGKKNVLNNEEIVVDAEEALNDLILSNPDADTTTKKTALKEAKETLQGSKDDLIIAMADITASDGDNLEINNFAGPGLQNKKEGLYALEKIDLFNLLCLPPYKVIGASEKPSDVDKSLIAKANAYCEKRRALLLVDSHSSWTDKDKAKAGITAGVGAVSNNAALFFPRLKQPNPLRGNQIEEFVPCGAVAGIMSRTDTQRGVWKAPAGIESTLRGVPELSVKLTDPENGELNPLGVNCLRSFPVIGRIIWGARTLRGADILADDYKYIPVRRLALFIEESLFRGTQWVVFEPNDEPLWSQIRLNLGAFMHSLFRQGAFQGTTAKQAYFVKCDKDTTTQNDIDRGIVNIVVGFAPLKPAEFVIIKLQQIAGDLEV